MMRLMMLGCLVALAAGCVQDTEPDTDNDTDMAVLDAAPTPDMVPADAGDPRRDMMPPPTPDDPCADPVDLNAALMGMGGETQYQTRLGGQMSRLQGSCGGNGPEQVLEFVAPAAGRWFFTTARPDTTVDTVLYVQTECGQAASEIACNDDGGADFHSELSLDLQADQRVFVVLDGFGQEGGSVTLAVGQPAVSALGESCDDLTLSCPDGTTCFRRGDSRVCEEVRPREVGEACDRAGQLGACVAGSICYGFGNPVCEAVRERDVGERCDQAGELGACVAGSICYGLGEDAVCAEVRVRQEGERCDRQGGIGPCDAGLECRQLGEGFNDTFCVAVDILPEGALCAADGSTGRCEAGTLCQADGDMAPTCIAAERSCPDDWPAVDLNASPGGAGWRVEAALTPDTVVNTRLCRPGPLRDANVFVFVAEADGLHTFETLPPAQGEGFDTLLDVRGYCAFAGDDSVIACDDDGGAMFLSRADVVLAAGEAVYVLVGSVGAAGGAYALEVTGP